MKIVETYLDAVKVIELDTHADERGYFEEIYSQKEINRLGIDFKPVQDNCSFSSCKGTVRGLHWQNPPMGQSKLIRCTKGRIVDVSVDIRINSPTFGKYVLVEITENDHRLVFIPQGFAHGVAILEDDSVYNYKVENFFSKEDEATLAYDDPTVNINWDTLFNGADVITSSKDKQNPTLDKINSKFVYKETK